MIKYTGFGNAAGMFASRSLLADAAANRDYSSDSENSDTEEYLEYKDKYVLSLKFFLFIENMIYVCFFFLLVFIYLQEFSYLLIVTCIACDSLLYIYNSNSFDYFIICLE